MLVAKTKRHKKIKGASVITDKRLGTTKPSILSIFDRHITKMCLYNFDPLNPTFI